MRAKNKIICMLDCTGCKFWDECTASNEQYIEKIKSALLLDSGMGTA